MGHVNFVGDYIYTVIHPEDFQSQRIVRIKMDGKSNIETVFDLQNMIRNFIVSGDSIWFTTTGSQTVNALYKLKLSDVDPTLSYNEVYDKIKMYTAKDVLKNNSSDSEFPGILWMFATKDWLFLRMYKENGSHYWIMMKNDLSQIINITDKAVKKQTIQ